MGHYQCYHPTIQCLYYPQPFPSTRHLNITSTLKLDWYPCSGHSFTLKWQFESLILFGKIQFTYWVPIRSLVTLVKIKLKLGRVNFKQFSKVNYLGCICRGPIRWIQNTEEITGILFKISLEYLSLLVSAQINCSREARSHSYKLSCSYQVEGWEDKCFSKLKIPHELSPPCSLLTRDAIQAI